MNYYRRHPMNYYNPFLDDRHKVFLSYYHDDDQYYRELFEDMFSDHYDIMVSKSVQLGDIDDERLSTDRIREIIRDDYLQDSTVTVVLVGAHTWQRKFVDWEIGSSIRLTKNSTRSGLLGILLPTYPGYATNTYSSYTLPPRLSDNIVCGFATIHRWSNDPDQVQSWIHEAFLRRDEVDPDNSYPSFKQNRPGARWN